MSDLLVFAALRFEAAALPKVPGWTVLRSGMGPARARIAAARGLAVESPAVAIAGVCGAVSPELRAGDVVCATELRRQDGDPITVPSADVLAAAVRRRGLRAHTGTIYCVETIMSPGDRRALEADGVLAVDMESAWLAEAADGRPLAVLRVVLDTAARSVFDPRTLAAGFHALRALHRAAFALGEWTAASAEVASPERARAYLEAP
jgi:4-hydroxy-3-methylbut-2-en-1-yl diphosphate reductase